MLRAPFSSRSNGTEPVLDEQHQRTRHRCFVCHRGGRIVAVLRETANRGEDETAEDIQGGPDYQESRPPSLGVQVHLAGIRPRVSCFVRVSAERCPP